MRVTAAASVIAVPSVVGTVRVDVAARVIGAARAAVMTLPQSVSNHRWAVGSLGMGAADAGVFVAPMVAVVAAAAVPCVVACAGAADVDDAAEALVRHL